MPNAGPKDPDAAPLRCTFEVEHFEPAGFSEEVEQAGLGRATVRKRFGGGDLLGTGTVEMLFWRPDESSGTYLALELIDGTLAGRHGTFLLQHGGSTSPTGEQTWVEVVPGSGTGELSGLSGTGRIEHGLLELDAVFAA
jgi:hypothetical protein